MHVFKDKNGTEWAIDLTLDKIRHIEAADFSAAFHAEEPRHIQFFPPQDDLFTDIITNPAVAFGMVWICCQQQANDRGIQTEEEFANLFNGKSLQDSRIAFYEELPGFFPEMATTLAALVERFTTIQKRVDQKLSEGTKRLISEERVDRVIDEALAGVEAKMKVELGE